MIFYLDALIDLTLISVQHQAVPHYPVITDVRMWPYMGVLGLSDRVWVAGGLQEWLL